jgi:hypothetical protein
MLCVAEYGQEITSRHAASLDMETQQTPAPDSISDSSFKQLTDFFASLITLVNWNTVERFGNS